MTDSERLARIESKVDIIFAMMQQLILRQGTTERMESIMERWPVERDTVPAPPPGE